ncbi:cell envelope integrity protein CreD [Roseomonas sp. CECT 9278]|uniref:cell envelope integrity protein CreD n=1 Tax=Roseomonas sp. CECT 9278 TaxID=2845823 RepID=UPI001E28F5D0|nr:cell envelope integrity protein CreD [Roseomonas sp. CECT 9278]CAH0204729.1 Inner membrane protein CreD [Roseomonas sp. CECT 9278]
MSDTAAPPEPAPPAANPLAEGARLLGPAGLKLALVGALVVALLVPQYMVAGLIAEREERQGEVRAEIGRAWGAPQTVLGPVLVVPVLQAAVRGSEPGAIAIPAAELSMAATLRPEARRRGLFEAIVYAARIEITGRLGDAAAALPADVTPDWRGAYLLTGATDLRPTAEAPTLSLGGRALPVEREGAARCGAVEALRWPLGLEGPPEPGLAFAGSMDLRGTEALAMLPIARRLRFSAEAAWETPSYFGSSLPHRTSGDGAGFRAEWVGGMAERSLRLPADGCGAVLGRGAGMGVALLEGVPTYRMVNRTAKYAALFVLLAVMTYWLFELVSRVRIHLLQYGLLGLSMVLFPMLLLAISEAVGFGLAYAVSAAMVMAQACLYTAGVTGRVRLAAVFGGVLAALFGFLYVVLRMESMALLAGAIGLFALLSAVMLATRGIAARGG